MADLSGVCDSHGVTVFVVDNDAERGDSIVNNVCELISFGELSAGWYWASTQHGILTGKPNGPHPSRVAALADALVIMSVHDSNTVLRGSDLGK